MEQSRRNMARKKWGLTDRTRTLLKLELAIVLPAAALMAFSIWNLKHIQRSEAVEAAIERDFSHILHVAEKKAWYKANDLITPAREQFPSSGEDRAKIDAQLDRVLSSQPGFAYAFLYDKNKNLFVSRVQPARDNDMTFCAISQEMIKAATSWLPVEASHMIADLRQMEAKNEPPVAFDGGWFAQGNQQYYYNFAYFIPPRLPKDDLVMGVIAFDDDYLRDSFFPEIFKEVLTSKSEVLRG